MATSTVATNTKQLQENLSNSEAQLHQVVESWVLAQRLHVYWYQSGCGGLDNKYIYLHERDFLSLGVKVCVTIHINSPLLRRKIILCGSIWCHWRAELNECGKLFLTRTLGWSGPHQRSREWRVVEAQDWPPGKDVSTFSDTVLSFIHRPLPSFTLLFVLCNKKAWEWG